ncbi:MAG TPA: acyl-[ACP]--phospholipid O-acyltransferase [Candidatus Binatia bacterium]|jgi:acyl-[acyl-carrier-protein]-phospholipid O-acyltransferase/long-chain-fatty-acid--[acyl-carrier-protein] ligase
MAAGKYKDTLADPGLRAFLWTQFLGALNDNVFKIIVSLRAADLGLSSGGSAYLSLVGAVYILPFFLFSGYAGHLADVLSKRAVLVATKVFEIAAMALGVVAFLSGRFEFLLAVLFLLALHSTFFSPAKYGILPEMLPEKELSRANGLLEMSTFMAIILGITAGSLTFAAWKDHLEWIGLLLTVIAVAGTLTSFGIPKVAPSGARKKFRLDPWAEIRSGVKHLRADRTLWLTVIGISYFWFVGALLQMDLFLLGKEIMALDDVSIGLLVTFLALGIGVGSLAAGRLSGDKVEMGLVPLGSLTMAFFTLLLFFSSGSYAWTSVMLSLLAFSGGLFVVPLNALLQQRSGREEKGLLIATNNFFNMVGVLLASAALWIFHDLLRLSSAWIVLILGLFTLAATIHILTILPDFLIRFTVWMLAHTIYRIRIVGQEHVPFHGPALLVCNHLSYIDPLLVGASVQRFIRFLMYAPYYEIRWVNWIFRLMKAIPVSARNRRDIVQSIARARAELADGHVVCIFAEGSISRTGNLLPFKRGFEKILEGLDAGLDIPIIPVHLDRLWGSIFSFKDGHFFWKWPERIPYPVTISFGRPLPASTTAEEARQAIMELGSEAINHRREARDLLQLRFLKTAKRKWFSFCMADSTGKELSYGKAAAASLLLSGWVKRRCAGESMVGLLLPASVGGALANIAVLTAGKVPVNLNFTAGSDAMAQALSQCGIKTIVTSRVFLAKGKLAEIEGMIFIEDALAEAKPAAKIIAAVGAFILPARLLLRLYGNGDPNAESLATVIFSSGSTGTPKGVMLSHHNVLSNIEGFAQVFWVTNKDRMMGVLPFFHSFGFTGTLWFPLISGFGVAYHPNPLDAKTIGEMIAKYQATILISTPTFYAAYVKKCSSEQLATLRYAVAGAERLRESLAKDFREKYGIDLLEGYGATEMAPVIAVNTPDVQQHSEHQTGRKPGTVGHPIPGVAVKVVDRDTGAMLPSGAEGLLLVQGPNRMLGYLGQPELTGEVFRDGWYVTGDVASIDEEGFIRITDRLSRFSKIGGEMVPHLKVEEAINRILGDQGCVVIALPDEQKGERLAALYTNKEIAPDELWNKLNQTDLPKLWIPRRDSFFHVEEIPLLGSGKVDLKKAKTAALEKSAG